MTHRGMVHALHNVRRVLADEGLLLDIHSVPGRRIVFCEIPEGRVAVGYLRESRSHARYRTAQTSLDRAVAQGLFRVRAASEFHFLHHARSLPALRRYFTRDWVHASVGGATARRINRLLGSRRKGVIIIDEVAQMTVLEKR